MRNIKKKRYLIAFILTVFIFVFGIMVGLVMESQRVQFVQDKAYEQKLDYRSLQFQYQFIDQLSQENNCPVLANALNVNLETLEDTRIRLTNYNLDAKISKDDFEMLYRDYILSQLNYWLLAKKARELCNFELATILYFFSTDKDCPDCGEQAFILTYLKNLFGDKLLNFALNSQFRDEKSLELLMETYSINVFPTLLIEGRKFEGLAEKQTILREICKHYKDMEECY
ncbi:hypothetical protein CMO90_00120 [Candidatus Woesearchaeota archaeon]|jgi:hypothetical protein|nr:hypothetical protein [Candidatus Woesearchaeota archaeon]|tara:strand:- start:193 stop:876 length:684 start_codon:yes stop_codon:yes gene_type:complete